MPIKNIINIRERLIETNCYGEMKPEDFDEYIRSVWSTMQYYGFNELFDTREADWSNFDFSYLFKVASEAARLDTLDPESKLAWIVNEGKEKQLTDFYKVVKAQMPVRSRGLEAFYTSEEALKWLGLNQSSS